jgi:hypothetical protein
MAVFPFRDQNMAAMAAMASFFPFRQTKYMIVRTSFIMMMMETNFGDKQTYHRILSQALLEHD